MSSQPTWNPPFDSSKWALEIKIEKLKADNAKLRAAIQRVLDSFKYEWELPDDSPSIVGLEEALEAREGE